MLFTMIMGLDRQNSKSVAAGTCIQSGSRISSLCYLCPSYQIEWLNARIIKSTQVMKKVRWKR
jgi:hypothetical protein